MIAPSGQRSTAILSRSVLLQLLAIGGLSTMLGFTFNAANPVGVRFSEPTATSIATTADGTETTGATASFLPPLPHSNHVGAVTSNRTNVATAATTTQVPATRPIATTTPWSVSTPGAIPNPVLPAAPVAPAAAITNPTAIHWPEAKALATEGRAVLVDVRHKSMYDAGHIPGAISLPEMSPPEEFKTFLSQQATNTILIVYCSSTSCSQSARVATRLVNEFHWPAVRFMTGGYLEYQQAELANPAPTQ